MPPRAFRRHDTPTPIQNTLPSPLRLRFIHNPLPPLRSLQTAYLHPAEQLAPTPRTIIRAPLLHLPPHDVRHPDEGAQRPHLEAPRTRLTPEEDRLVGEHRSCLVRVDQAVSVVVLVVGGVLVEDAQPGRADEALLEVFVAVADDGEEADCARTVEDLRRGGGGW